MSFATPLVLVGLLIVPVAIVWYAMRVRQSRRVAAAFTTAHMAPSSTPSRPRWRRHTPLAVLLVALAVLVGAAAEPQRTVAVPVQRASIMLLFDVSSSMRATDVSPSRLVAAKKSAKEFVASVPAGVSVGVIAFNQAPTLLQSPTRDKAAVRTAIDRMVPSGNTATGDAITTATGLLTAQPAEKGKRPPGAIVLLSDGKSTSGVDPVTAAKAAGKKKIPISTVALGTAQGTVTVPKPSGGTVVRHVPPDPAAMAAIAKASGGQTFQARDADKLGSVYQHLGATLGHEQHKRPLTAGFAGGALILILLAAGLSLRWFGRLI